MTPIPTFPQFRRLEIGDRPAIEAITRRAPPSSDFVFTSLWCWDTDETCVIALLDGNLVVRFKDYAADTHFYSFLGDHAIAETAQTLLAHASRQGLPAQLKLIPESVVAADDRLARRLSITDDRDNWDYVYAIVDWAVLPGGPHRKHRQQVARCRRQSALTFSLLDLRDVAVQAAIVDVSYRWAQQKPAAAGDDRRHELVALRRLFALAGHERLGACGLYKGRQLVGFSIWEVLPCQALAIAHFRKTDRSYDGLTTYLRHEESRLLLARGCRFMNIEQDLGLAGLRRAKLSLRTCGFVRKYVISERPGQGTDSATTGRPGR
ncbi:MAG: uncharacterized protein QOF33_3101 [Thermomicrobiales bacterium]|nr:uncharacterized protein [Thermomicrobiales bacterium]